MHIDKWKDTHRPVVFSISLARSSKTSYSRPSWLISKPSSPGGTVIQAASTSFAWPMVSTSISAIVSRSASSSSHIIISGYIFVFCHQNLITPWIAARRLASLADCRSACLAAVSTVDSRPRRRLVWMIELLDNPLYLVILDFLYICGRKFKETKLGHVKSEFPQIWKFSTCCPWDLQITTDTTIALCKVELPDTNSYLGNMKHGLGEKPWMSREKQPTYSKFFETLVRKLLRQCNWWQRWGKTAPGCWQAISARQMRI